SEWALATTAEPDVTESAVSEESLVDRPNGGNGAADRRDGNQEVATLTGENPWTGLLQQGAVLLQQLAAASSDAGDTGTAAAPSDKGQSFIRRDLSTGESYLRIAMPAPEVLDQALRMLPTLLDSLRR
ncbi:MAG: hypothetical protein ABIW48_05225, partial [Burkholderiales bacterium]